MNDTARRFRACVDCLLDPTRAPLDQLQASREWCAWGLATLGIDERNLAQANPALVTDAQLHNGKAISPLGAVLCIREYRRTAVFLQAMDAAIRAARERFPGETIHVVEAGCGPMAPLAFSMAARFPPDQVTFTLLDLHPAALDGAKRAAEALEVAQSIRGYVAADATQYQFAPEDRPHVIACEVLLRALSREPQVAATVNLAPQLRPGGIFVPERIDVDAVLFDSNQYFQPAALGDDSAAEQENAGAQHGAAVRELGNVFRLDAAAAERLAQGDPTHYAAAEIALPAFNPAVWELNLFTRIRVFGDHVLKDFESSLNLPEKVSLPARTAAQGGVLRFVYEVSQDPGLRLIAQPA